MTSPAPVDPRETASEQELIASIIAGQRDNFHLLIRPYETQLYRTAFALMRNEAEAEDVVQDAVLKAYRKLASFRGDSKFSTWLIAITLNEARARLRRENRVMIDSLDAQPEERGDFTPAALTDWREVPLAALERQEIRELVQSAVAQLPDAYREIVTLRDVEELSVNETAALLGISISLVKVRLHRARMMLQKKLVPHLKQIGKKASKSRVFGRLPWL
ncbi:MAG TPA: sigma-70 family RNA polymerase sigma factor [Silvibacterium sp.]|nr:sigma-70 family RNA polymerase sigma factor [Silvibacterium sp.]